MKVTVIYESIYGNTAAIAEAIAEGLRTHSEVGLRAVDDVPVTADYEWIYAAHVMDVGTQRILDPAAFSLLS